MRFPSERKTGILHSEISTFFSLCDVNVPTLSQWRISLSVQQSKTSSFLKHLIEKKQKCTIYMINCTATLEFRITKKINHS